MTISQQLTLAAAFAVAALVLANISTYVQPHNAKAYTAICVAYLTCLAEAVGTLALIWVQIS